MSDRCSLTLKTGAECLAAVPPGAPLALCIKHMVEAHNWVKDACTLRAFAQYRETGEITAGYPDDAVPRGLPRVRTSRPEVDGPVVYYLLFADRIKIGTTQDLPLRLSGVPHDELLATEPGSYDVERRRHRQFVHLHLVREWFRDCPELRQHIASLQADG